MFSHWKLSVFPMTSACWENLIFIFLRYSNYWIKYKQLGQHFTEIGLKQAIWNVVKAVKLTNLGAVIDSLNSKNNKILFFLFFQNWWSKKTFQQENQEKKKRSPPWLLAFEHHQYFLNLIHFISLKSVGICLTIAVKEI